MKEKSDSFEKDALSSAEDMNIEVTKEPPPYHFRARIACGLCSNVITYTKGNRAWMASNFIAHMSSKHPKDGLDTGKKRKKSLEQPGQRSITQAFKTPRFSKNHDGNNPSSSSQLTGNAPASNIFLFLFSSFKFTLINYHLQRLNIAFWKKMWTMISIPTHFLTKKS